MCDYHSARETADNEFESRRDADPAEIRDSLDPTPDTQLPSSTARPAPPNEPGADEPVSAWTTLGELCAARLRRQFRFDQDSRTWFEWRDGTHWVEIRDTKIITDILHHERMRLAADLGDKGQAEFEALLTNDSDWRRETRSITGEWWAAVRRTISRQAPSPPNDLLATADGVVDLSTGDIQPHDALIHDTVALTAGRFRPREIEYLKATLWDRLQHNISYDDFEQLIAILGVAVARRCIDYCSILWLVGKSGSGKSAAADLILAAFGGMALGASAGVLARHSRSDIDADLTDLLQMDPVVLCVSEVERVGLSRLLSITGGDRLGARRPHGQMQRGSLSGIVVATSVEAPKMAVDTGIRRRVAVIPFPAKVDESIEHNRLFDQDELDSVVTLSIVAALDVGKSGWAPPQGNIAAKEAFLAEADPVAEWLQSLPDDWHGHPLQQILDSYNREMPEPTTSTTLGRRISASDRWTRVENKTTRLRHLTLAERPLSQG